MKIRKLRLGFTILVFLFCVLTWLVIAAWRQQALDYDLTEAVGRRDIPKVRRLLDAGASPEAQWSGYSWQDRLDFFVKRTHGYRGYTVLDRVEGDTELTNLMLKYKAKR